MPYRKAWEVGYVRDRAAGRRRYVDVAATRDRLLKLSQAGVPTRMLARASGLSDTAISAIVKGRRRQVQQATVGRVAALTLARIYSEQDHGHVPKIGAVRRIQASQALGWRHEDLFAAGARDTARVVRAPGQLIDVRGWQGIHAVYERLSMVPGPSSLARAQATRRGYAPPLAWDEESIDHPDAMPNLGLPEAASRDREDVDEVAVCRVADYWGEANLQLPKVERSEAVRLLAARGSSDIQIADRLGISSRTVLRLRRAHGISPGVAPSRR